MEDRQKIEPPTLPEALGAYAGRDCARFHMPGHKARGMGGFWRDELIRWDVTELSCTDDLHRPEQAILRAQKNMAHAYGASASFFVVNGSTGAVQAMLLSLAREEKLLLARDAHRSAVSGAALSGIRVDYMLPAFDAACGMFGMVTPETLEAELTRSGATAVLLTSPNYYGLCADLPALSRVAHAHGALLLVDAAHGAHFPFSDALPKGAGGYADLWAHSQHKTMDALTQAASVHLGKCRVRADDVSRALDMIETSSPSYLLMSSLDWSVYMGRRRNWTAQVARCVALGSEIEKINGLSLLPELRGAGVAERDRTRLVIDVTQRGLTGFAAQAALEAANVFVEMADLERIVLITSPEDDPAWYERLIEALAQLPYGVPRPRSAANADVYRTLPEKRMPLRDAALARLVRVPLMKAAGRIAGEPVGVYPPGIALTMPGEAYSPETLAFLEENQQAGAALFGVRGGCVLAVDE